MVRTKDDEKYRQHYIFDPILNFFLLASVIGGLLYLMFSGWNELYLVGTLGFSVLGLGGLMLYLYHTSELRLFKKSAIAITTGLSFVIGVLFLNLRFYFIVRAVSGGSAPTYLDVLIPFAFYFLSILAIKRLLYVLDRSSLFD
jgi:hypothetical protein